MTSTDQQRPTEDERLLAEAHRASAYIDQELGDHLERGELLGQGTPDDEDADVVVRIVAANGYRMAKHINMAGPGIWASVAVADAGGVHIAARRIFIAWEHVARLEQMIGA